MCRIHRKTSCFCVILKLFGVGDQIHRKNVSFYSNVIKLIVKTDVLWRGCKNEEFIVKHAVFEQYGVRVASSSARLGSVWHGSARIGSVGLGPARLGSAWPGSARLGLARLGFAPPLAPPGAKKVSKWLPAAQCISWCKNCCFWKTVHKSL